MKPMPSEMTLLLCGENIAVLEGETLVEYYPNAQADATLVGAVYAGKVERVLKDMKTAFVDIGQPKNGFLPLSEQSAYQKQQGEKPLLSGGSVLVQVKKNPKDDKGAFLTRDITLVGEYALLMPLNRHVGASSRIKDEAAKRALIELGVSLAGDRFGLIMRHAALDARRAQVEEEIESLYEKAQDILQKAQYAKPPALLNAVNSTLKELTRDYGARYAIETLSSEAAQARAQSVRVAAQLSAALERRVDLPNGGTLIIDPREALTTIDVNTAHFTGERGSETALHQNLAACEQIARQIRLRNLSGIIIIDFIDMPSDDARSQVMAALEKAVSADRVKTVLHGFTSLGLFEMTRKRTREPISNQLCKPCPRCHGLGLTRGDA